MKKKEKRMLLILIIVSALIISIIWLITRGGKDKEVVAENTVKEEFVQVLDDGTKLNISSKLNETKKLGNFEIGNIQLTHKNGMSVVLADVVNKGSAVTNWTIIEVTLLDKNGNTINVLEGVIEDLQPGESTQLNMQTSSDYANAYDFTVKIK